MKGIANYLTITMNLWMAIQIISSVVSRLLKGMTLKDHLLEAKESFPAVAQSRRALCTVCAVTHYFLFAALLAEMLWWENGQCRQKVVSWGETQLCRVSLASSKPITGWPKLCFVRQLTGTPAKCLTALNSSVLQGGSSLGYYLLSQCRSQWLGSYWHIWSPHSLSLLISLPWGA